MNLRRQLLLASAIFLAAFWSGCSSSSVLAPQVDLPAPIAGNVTSSAPDADGNVHIMGTAGAVPGGSMLMAVNEAAASAKLFKALDLLVASASAQTISFPPVCDLPGHSCTLAAADGSFEIILLAAIGDAISIGIIDPETGDFISELLQLIIAIVDGGTGPGPSPTPSTNCAGLPVSGKAVDVKIIPGTKMPVLLKQGSETTTNQLVIGTTIVNIDGCYAHSVAIKNAIASTIFAVTSKEDSTLWTGTFIDGVLTMSQHFVLSMEPMHIAFADSDSQPLVVLKTADSIQLSNVSLVNGQILSRIAPTINSAEVSGIARSTKLSILQMASSPVHYLGLLLSDVGAPQSYYVTIFQADGLSNIRTWDVQALSAAQAVVDGELFASEPFTTPSVKFVLLDSGNAPQTNAIVVYPVNTMTGDPLLIDADITFSSTQPSGVGTPKSFPGGDGGVMKNVAVASNAGNARAIMSTSSGNLEWLDLNNSSTMTPAPWAEARGVDLVAIAVGTALPAFFAADQTNGLALDGTDVLGNALLF
jgi:hypothetical protein